MTQTFPWMRRGPARSPAAPRRGMTIVEVLISVLVVSLGFSSIVSLLILDAVGNDFEQERARAHQMVNEELELVKRTLYTRITGGRNVTVWNNGTLNNTADDTVGTMEVIVRNPITHASLSVAPVPAIRVQVEVTLTWHPRGRFNNKTMHETLMTYIAP